jgi:hypothetical protein
MITLRDKFLAWFNTPSTRDQCTANRNGIRSSTASLGVSARVSLSASRASFQSLTECQDTKPSP